MFLGVVLNLGDRGPFFITKLVMGDEGFPRPRSPDQTQQILSKPLPGKETIEAISTVGVLARNLLNQEWGMRERETKEALSHLT